MHIERTVPYHRLISPNRLIESDDDKIRRKARAAEEIRKIRLILK